MNTFSDDNAMPYPFDMRTVPGINPGFANAITVQKFPDVALNGGYPTMGNTGLNDTNYYSWGVNGALTKLAGSHSLKTGADYRIIGVDAMQNGNSAGDFTFSGVFTRAGNTRRTKFVLPTLCLAIRPPYPCVASALQPFVKYYAWFVQDDWRVSNKLTVNYGVRLEHETGPAKRTINWWSASTATRRAR